MPRREKSPEVERLERKIRELERLEEEMRFCIALGLIATEGDSEAADRFGEKAADLNIGVGEVCRECWNERIIEVPTHGPTSVEPSYRQEACRACLPDPPDPD